MRPAHVTCRDRNRPDDARLRRRFDPRDRDFWRTARRLKRAGKCRHWLVRAWERFL